MKGCWYLVVMWALRWVIKYLGKSAVGFGDPLVCMLWQRKFQRIRWIEARFLDMIEVQELIELRCFAFRAIYFYTYAQSKQILNTVFTPDTSVVHLCSAACAGKCPLENCLVRLLNQANFEKVLTFCQDSITQLCLMHDSVISLTQDWHTGSGFDFM